MFNKDIGVYLCNSVSSVGWADGILVLYLEEGFGCFNTLDIGLFLMPPSLNC